MPPWVLHCDRTAIFAWTLIAASWNISLTGISYRLYIAVRGLERKISTLVRQIALEDMTADADI